MSIWFILWLLLSVALLFFAGWTVYIMLRQKESWRAFAKKYKLRYSAKKNFMAPEISGSIEGLTITMFTSEHIAPDARGARKMSAIEISLVSRMPFSGAIGSGVMAPIIQELSYKGEVKPAVTGWQDSYIARTNSRAAMDAYLTSERVESLLSIMKLKTSSVIFIFEAQDTLLRLDTPDPLETLEKIDRIVKKMIKVAQVLELKDNESTRLLIVADKPKDVAKKLEAPEEVSGLQLED